MMEFVCQLSSVSVSYEGHPDKHRVDFKNLNSHVNVSVFISFGKNFALQHVEYPHSGSSPGCRYRL